MLVNALSTVALLLSAISGTDAFRTGRHHRGLESRHAAHVPADKRTLTYASNATAGEHIGKRRITEGEEGIDASNSTEALSKRAYPGSRATFYAIGLGACGQYNHEPDFVVALNSAQYGGGYPGPECFKYITITGGSRNGYAVAQIVDECPTCPYGGLDMSIALFEKFASQDEGVASITWWYNDGSDKPTTSEAPAPPTSTYTPPTSTYVAPPTTSTTPAWTPPATTHEEPKTTSTTPAWTSTTSTWQAPTTSSSVWVAPTTSSTSTWQAPSSSSTWSSSSSVWTTSSSASAASSSPSGASSAISTFSNLMATSTRISSAATAASTTVAAPSTTATKLASGGDDTEEDTPVSVSVLSNLDLLSTYTAQLGSLVVVAAQMVIA
ncbi:hypothetical protein QFC22_004144 [Naganishia vaughanmartiniae]|uniref:Uncharacterized protein n=1 Tax=Naganishia vaughanmartiniae TaxID=1424756 RepID=A0ACC2X2W0_9TREE|nr:hypothetical protein QFC22_004144 [Naganishia vaughanmartiniae]